MDLFGIGTLELVVVLLVALLVLGPARMVEVARSVGKFWREAQQTLRQAADMATVELDKPINSAVPREPIDQPEASVAREGEPDEDAETEGPTQTALPGFEPPTPQASQSEERLPTRE